MDKTYFYIQTEKWAFLAKFPFAFNYFPNFKSYGNADTKTEQM